MTVRCCPECGADLTALFEATCADCGAKVPVGQGLGFSTDKQPDEAHGRPVKILPLCKACIGKRLAGC